MAEENKRSIVQEDEIDLAELARSIRTNKRFLLKITGIFVLIGLLIAFTSRVEYEASCKLLPESQEPQTPSLGGLAGLAGLAGVDLSGLSGSSAGVLTPQLYPEIVSSLPFLLEVMNDTVYFEQGDFTSTPFYYFKNIARPSLLEYTIKYTIGLPGTIKDILVDKKEIAVNESEYYRFSKADWKLIENFKERITVEIDRDTGIIEIVVKMPDPMVSAQIAKKIELMITDAVIEYKTEKALKRLEFIEESYEEAKTEFENVQLKLARVTDQNQNVTSATAQIEVQKIEHEYNIAFEVYKGLSSQVEQAKIQLKEETPVFTVLEPVRIPEGKSEPKRMLIILAAAMAGLVVSVTIVVGKNLMFGFSE